MNELKIAFLILYRSSLHYSSHMKGDRIKVTVSVNAGTPHCQSSVCLSVNMYVCVMSVNMTFAIRHYRFLMKLGFLWVL